MSLVFLNDRAVRSATAFGSLNTGSMVFIKKLTASSSSTLTFHNGTSDVVLDSTYKEYLFTFKHIHPSAESDLLFQANVSGGADFNETITSTFFRSYHNEAGSDTTLAYVAGLDQAQGTGFSTLTDGIGSASNTVNNDDNASGYLRLFNPASTTFVKHFIGVTNQQNPAVYSVNNYFAGYFNTTSAIDEIQFKMASGNIDAGDICLYGIL
jgi:hypothetical protein|tara:strand:+ start:513 stop:1142 length:630 start_codon:yes stop_codon:yes gene_type:complete